MNAFKLTKYFTLVVFLLTASILKANAASFTPKGGETPGAFYARCLRESCTQDNVTGTETTPGSNSYDRCRDQCQAARDAIGNSDCRDLYRSYTDATTKAAEECAKSNVSSVSACISQANSCGAALNTDSSNGDSVVSSIQNLLGAMGSAQNNSSTRACFEDVEGEEERQERLDERIQRLRDENEDSVTKQADLDDEFSRRKEEVNEKILEAEEDVNKKKIERQTRQQEESSRIQKAVLKAEKTKYDNLTQINKLNIEKANLQFAQQQIVIEFSSARINKTCRDKVMALKDALTAPTVAPPVSGTPAAKPVAKKFSVREAQKIKQDLKLEEQSCLQTEALKKSAQIKGLADKRAGLEAQIETLNRAITDEEKAINIEKQAFEELKKTMTQEEQQQEEAKIKKLNNLSQSLAKFAETIDRKKKSLDSRIASRNELIRTLTLSKQNKKDRFATVSGSLSSRQSAQQDYIETCCSQSTKDLYCSRVQSDSRTNSYSPVTGSDGSQR